MINEYRDAKDSLERLNIVFREIEKTGRFSKKAEKDSERRLFLSQMKSLENKFLTYLSEFKVFLNRIVFEKLLDPSELEKGLTESYERSDMEKKFMSKGGRLFALKEILPDELENETVKRIKEKKKKREEETRKKKTKDSSYYTKISSKFFSKVSLKLLSKESFSKMEGHLIKANLNYTPVGYVSIVLMTTFLSIFVAGFLFFFF